MENDERPRKLPKLGHEGAEEPAHSELGPAMTGAVSVANEPQDNAVSSVEVGEKDNTEPSENAELSTLATVQTETPDDGAPKMSKNQQKKLKRREKWEQDRESRKDIRKQKNAERRGRRKQTLQEAREQGGSEAVKAILKGWETTKSRYKKSTLLPLAIVIDCDYDDLMNHGERISLASQMTRCYSDNSRSLYRTHLMFSSFDKLLRERFDTVLTQHKNWKGIKFTQEDFVHAARIAKEDMASPRGGKLVGPFAELGDAKPEDGEIIYLSSDSENTLTELKPYNTYVIGGLVDKNRHKAVCYKNAVEKGVKTAKLPIGDYIQMASRQVLTTNHVVEIMLRWLELGDWGEAFLKVLPQRKGGKLLAQSSEAGDDGMVEEEQDEDIEDEAAQIQAVEEAASHETSE